MKALITVAPAQFRDGMQTIAYPYTALYRGEVEVKNAQELASVLIQVREQINESAAIFVKPLTRKFGGFDAWKGSNHGLFQVVKEAVSA